MPQPNPSFDELASITISEYSDELRDNITNNIPLYAMMEDEGAIITEDGGIQLLENLDYQDNQTFQWFTGYEYLNVTPSEVFTTAAFDWKEANCNIVFSKREVSQNSGRSKRFDLINSKTKNAEKTMRNNVAAAMFYLGTESSGKAFGGTQYIMADDPTTGIVGGINRATTTNAFWRNQTMDESGDSITLAANTILDAMELLYIRCTRGMDVPNLWVYGNTYWRYFAAAVNTNQRYIRESKSETAKVSFPYYLFKNKTKVFHDPNCGATRGYAINTDYFKLKVHKDRNFNVEKAKQPTNQAATVIPVDLMANIVCGNASLQGVMLP